MATRKPTDATLRNVRASNKQHMGTRAELRAQGARLRALERTVLALARGDVAYGRGWR